MPASKRNTDSSLPENKKDLNLIDLVLGCWLLAHDLADRVIHARSVKKSKGYSCGFLELTHTSEEKVKSFIVRIAEELGLATKKELKEVENLLKKLKNRQKRR